MTDDWGGAQWLVAFWFAIRLLAMPTFRIAFGEVKLERRAASWMVRYGCILVEVAVATAILAWGGFW